MRLPAERKHIREGDGVTEGEAKKKWCPLARWTGGKGGVAINRRVTGEAIAATSCIGSDCMAWRWAAAFIKDGYCGAFGSEDNGGG